MTIEAVVVALAAFAIGFSKVGIGGGLGPLITAVMALVFDPQVALAILLPILIVGDAFSMAALWGKWGMAETLALMPGAVIGVAAGTYLISSISPRGLRLSMGIVVLGFVVYFLVRPLLSASTRSVDSRWPGWLAGSAAGLTSALAHSGGPPVTIYLLFRRLQPVAFVATTVLVFTIVNLIKVPAYAAAGIFDWDLQLQFWWVLPLIPIGTLLGRKLVHRINPVLFQRVMVALLAVAGLMLVLR
ncbi:MAG TPA: sulfite exporter TauE/SafE family protein [Acidimicrobiia bacterium]|jgi:uncharacterized membrane protein YfcA|nr:sulfite exporter TauE/SafE family protein [Acidimicrobiia bacterium]